MEANSESHKTLPSYDDLPIEKSKPPGSSWGLWGEQDALGCFNLLTADRVKRGIELVRRGAVFALNYNIEFPNPPLFANRKVPIHRVSWLPLEVGHDDELSDWNTQTSSQWDGFRHIRHFAYGFYNGLDDEAHGIHHIAERGIVCRGVLADVARYRFEIGRPIQVNQRDMISTQDIQATLDRQNIKVEIGDILLIRTGWLTWYKQLNSAEQKQVPEPLISCGLEPCEEIARFLWNLHIAGIAADNPALEAWPPQFFSNPDSISDLTDPKHAAATFLHLSLLPLLGLPIGELWDLDALAADCAQDGVYEFLLTSAPLNIKNGVASPPNALAIK
jgi:kynurenine formamidase